MNVALQTGIWVRVIVLQLAILALSTCAYEKPLEPDFMHSEHSDDRTPASVPTVM